MAYTKVAKTTASYTGVDKWLHDFLLLQDNSYLLFQDNSKCIIQERMDDIYSLTVKPTATYTKVVKP